MGTQPDSASVEAPVATIPVLRPKLPDRSALAAYLERIDTGRWYSNQGPLLTAFEHRLAGLMGVEPDQLCCVSNGTMGLAVALRAAGAEPGRACAMPAWTFAGTPASALAAGLDPHFLDVSEASWALQPDMAAAAVAERGGQFGAIMPVAPFGAPLDRLAWEDVSLETGVPVVIDAAAAFDAVVSDARFRPGPAPMVISLHATKAFGIGEGGIIVSTDRDLVTRARRLANFGFAGAPEAEAAGWNAKLTEYAAAVGLALLDEWHDRRLAWQYRTEWYRDALDGIEGVAPIPGYGDGWVSSYCCVRVPDVTELADTLAAHSVETRPWWRQGCHRQPAFARYAPGNLPVTDRLAATTLGLPFSIDLPEDSVQRVAALVEKAVTV